MATFVLLSFICDRGAKNEEGSQEISFNGIERKLDSIQLVN